MSTVEELYESFKNTDENDTYGVILNDIRDQWNRDRKRLQYMDKPYSNAVEPLTDHLDALLETMRSDYRWDNIKCTHEKFRDTFTHAYELREEIKHCGYTHDVW